MDKAIGLDLGTTTLGIAVSDSLGFVHGLETFRFPKDSYKQAREKVHQVVLEKETKLIALGLPLNMDGSQGERAMSSIKFKEDLLKEDPSLIIELVDERLTTVAAHNHINEWGVNHQKRKDSVDRVAACEILDTFIRSRK